MAIVVNVHEAKTHFSRLLDQAHAGQEIVLAKAGKPYARLVPLEQAMIKRQAGRLHGVPLLSRDRVFESMKIPIIW